MLERLGIVDHLEENRRERLCSICLDNVFLDIAPIAQALKANIRMEHYTSNKKSAKAEKLLSAVKDYFPSSIFMKD